MKFIPTLGGNVVLKDIRLSHIVNCSQKGVFEGKQTLISVLKSLSSDTFMAEASAPVLRMRNSKVKGAGTPYISIIKQFFFLCKQLFLLLLG